jgi:hypothetical protein
MEFDPDFAVSASWWQSRRNLDCKEPRGIVLILGQAAKALAMNCPRDAIRIQ